VGHRDKGAFLTSAGNSQAERRTLASGPSTPPYKLVISRNESSNPIDLVPPGIDTDEVEFERVSGALKFCLLATGEADIHARSGPYMEWDCAAGDAILRSIGLTTYSRANGKPMVYNSESLYVRGLWVSRV
jgi:3'-phosphoadenosine 5'-phosphosulfate (PAPS) 3'-phosphatase